MNKKRRLVISDIHGCLKTLRVLVEKKIQLLKDDHLYLLGDYIDRGPNSSGVLDYIMTLIDSGYKIFPLRGNHEENLIKAVNEYDTKTLSYFVAKINKSPDLLDDNKKVKDKYIHFIKSLKYYYETNGYKIVHAGINFGASNPLDDKISMLELRKTTPDQSFLKGKRIVHGHQVTYLKEIIEAVNNQRTIIPLDNGCCYTKPHKVYDYTQTGHLCCLNLDSFDLTIQKKIEDN